MLSLSEEEYQLGTCLSSGNYSIAVDVERYSDFDHEDKERIFETRLC